MSQPVGRHRARRQLALRRPAVAATATLSALTLSAAGYASASDLAPSAAGSAHLSPQSAQGVLSLNSAGSKTAQQRRAEAGKKAALAKRASDARAKKAAASKAAADHLRGLVKDGASSATAMTPGAADAPKAAPKPAPTTLAADAKPSTERASRSTNRPVVTGGNPRAIAASMLGSYGWGGDQMGCLSSLWTKESGWNVGATNGSSGAYGIPQSLPGGKMASAGADWRTNPATQIRWGLGYIKSSYGSPCAAWGHSQATNWY